MTRTLVALVLMALAGIATAQVVRQATVTFAAPTKYTDGSSIPAGTAITYRVYQGSKGQANKPLIGTITTTSATVSAGLQAGTEYCWQVSAVINGQESALSNEACKSFPALAPEAVTITIT